MAKKMLIDATHAEETRVVVVDGNKVEEFDFESQSKRQLAGNIYLAKVTRVEPSLQAAFVDYGGNRHGFLAFSEIHPDYYQIPVADREALIAEERAYAESLAAEDEDEDKPKKVNRRRRSRSKPAAAKSDDLIATKDVEAEPKGMETIDLGEDDDQEGLSPMETVAETPVEEPEDDTAAEAPVAEEAAEAEEAVEEAQDEAPEVVSEETVEDDADDEDEDDAENTIESVANEDDHEDVRPVRKPRPKRYKIQEVIKVRQILLIQVVKEERGNKGAALTTYLSLAGRYCVLMPNTARGGGISRKITNAVDRKKLKEIATEMDVPDGAGLIIRTAGSQRTKAEIKRDYEYLQRLWEQIRELTLQSTAPAKIYEEGDLIKRTIRDLYSKEIDEVIVAGDTGYRTAKDFMKMIMPSHSKNVKPYNDQLPLFARYQVEGYLAGMFNPTVQLPSGGYIVIGVTEALVAIDVNSGRATKEGSIEQTALKTNLEAADEVARQMRLRDLAGLIVIDFIDMDERKNNTAVEKRLKDKLKTDRARIQVGRISGFGLLEMSRQRLRPGMLEATTQPCPHCHGTGLLRSDDNVALSILRQLEEEGVRGRSKEVLVRAPIAIANYLMNQKREHIAAIEATYGMAVRIECDPTLVSPDFAIEKFKTATRIVPEAAPVVSASSVVIDDLEDDIEDAEILDEDEADADASDAETAEGEGDGDDKPKKRRRRRRRRKKPGQGEGEQSSESDDEAEGGDADAEGDAPEAEATEAAEAAAEVEAEAPVEAPKPKRTRTRRKPAAAAEAAEGEATTTEAEAAEAPAEEAPKPKRTRTRKKPAVKAEEGEAVEAAPAEEAEEAPKPKRAPRARKKPAPKAEAVEAPAEVVAEPVAEATPEAPIEAAIEVAAPAPEPVAAPEPSPVAEPAPAPVASAAEAEEPKDDKPKRRGWWSLGR
ncbi:Rne/Rng family ribonuclease [Marivivens donghaensis]|uniref:Rne/Rng family ribonuclease n=1 Tax=Marivivens donghaensis TaxID=1699413 RepID=UPI003F6A043B